MSSLADAHHESRRRGKPHGTGTGNDEYTDSREQGLWQTVGSPNKKPDEECRQTDEDHDGYKDESYAIYDALHGSLGALCLLNHSDDVCKHGLLSHFLSAEAECSLFDDGTCQHLVACLFLNGNGFTGYHRFIDVSVYSTYHKTVNRYFLAWAYLDGIARLEGGDGNFSNGSVVYQMSLLGLQPHQGTDG